MVWLAVLRDSAYFDRRLHRGELPLGLEKQGAKKTLEIESQQGRYLKADWLALFKMASIQQ